jgi:hypothetical protein
MPIRGCAATSHLPSAPAGLTHRIEANLAEHACHLYRHTEGMTVIETDDLVIADSGIEGDTSTGADTFNIVADARFAPDEVENRLYVTAFKLRLTGRASSWWAGPNSARCCTPRAPHRGEVGPSLPRIGISASNAR